MAGVVAKNIPKVGGIVEKDWKWTDTNPSTVKTRSLSGNTFGFEK